MQGYDLIRAERIRQVHSEHYTAEKDKGRAYELAAAATAYLSGNEDWWPWDLNYFKPTTDQRDWIKAGALIAAAIDANLEKEVVHE